MTALDEALVLVKRFEGLKDGDARRPGLQPYRDPVGLWTIGWGHLLNGDPKAPMPDVTWAEEDAENHLSADLGHAALGVLRCTAVPLRDPELAALTSFAFNVGVGEFRSSTLRMRLNRGDRSGAAEQFGRWVYSRGVKLPGLVRRRAAERALFLS